jgi:hypothetical protein
MESLTAEQLASSPGSAIDSNRSSADGIKRDE